MQSIINRTLNAKKIISLAAITGLLGGCNTEPSEILGYSANQICSRYFISQEPLEFITSQVIPESLGRLDPPAQISLSTEPKQVSLTQTSEGETLVRTSVYREGLGCTLTYDLTAETIRSQSIETQSFPSVPLPINIDDSLSLEAFFAESSEEYSQRYNTFGVVVAQYGEIIAEQYDDQHDSTNPMLSWSMAKTITGLLAGVLEQQSLLSATDIIQARESSMSVENLMQMSSGLEWDESGQNGVSDLGTMWYLNSDSAGYAKDKASAYTPGSQFEYSTGTTQILAQYLGQTMGADLQAIYDYYQTEFFAPLGINNAVVEHDEVGTFRGGARVFLTPHDWIKIGQLLINKGYWNGQQLIAEQWIEDMMSPGTSPYYGGQLWLNDMKLSVPDLPEDTVSLRGFRGQYLVVIPSKNLVVARFGNFGAEVNSDINRANRTFMRLVVDLIEMIEN